MASSHRDIYITGLVNAHGAEKQAVQFLQRNVDRLEHYPELRARLAQHIQESERQAQRLEQILNGLGSSPSTLKDVGMQIMGNLQAVVHTPMQDEVLKNTFAGYAYEHFEIAAYRSLLVMAEVAGDTSGRSLLQESLNEEIAMAKWLEDHIGDTTRTYMRLESQGEKAGL